MNYTKCEHEWKVSNLIPKAPHIKCDKCGLSVEIYKTHVSVWDYGDGVRKPWIGKILFYEEA
uniref:Uncharacterized protein n=1 Tax=viral metagenome TaxID=1070528 RepID=A0A6M3KAY8_9ZZZZ